MTPQAAAALHQGAADRAAAESVFLALLDCCTEQGQSVSVSFHAANYGPKLLVERPDRDGYGRTDFETAMQSLFAAKSLRMIEYRRAFKQSDRVEVGARHVDGGE